MVHGYGEHSGRYFYPIEKFVKAGYDIYALDHVGHGRSGGTPGYIGHIENLTVDTETFIRNVFDDLNAKKAKADQTPVYLLGHSVGATITLAALARQTISRLVTGAVCIAPSLEPAVEVPQILIQVSSALSLFTPKLPITTIPPEDVSKDPAIVAAYRDDPFVFHKKLVARTGTEILNVSRWVKDNLDKIDTPLLLLHGTDDKIAAIAGTEYAYDHAASSDKKFIPYKGLYHEILNEPERDTVIGDITDWLSEHP